MKLPTWLQHDLAQSTLFLAGFALIGAITLSIANHVTRERIVENERQALLQRFNALLDPHLYDNQLLSDQVTFAGEAFGSTEPVTVYRARRGTTPIAALFVLSTPDGYSGKIRLAIGVNAQQSITGVRILQHKETPGLGDKIELEKSDWVLGFNQKSLTNPSIELWKVRKDGGEFDQFTGATITPRAIVGSIQRVLAWSNQQFDSLFQQPSNKAQP